tara:strand:- start:1944 stop:2588 length:645 start_codon:yes stop_codon:yes gene_type:complete
MSHNDWYNNIYNFIYKESILYSEPELNCYDDYDKYISLENKLQQNNIGKDDLEKITLKEIKFCSIKEIEDYLNKLFYINYNLSGNIFLENPLKHLVHHKFGDYDDLYGSSSFMIIFPNDGIRITCTKNFINTIPLLQQVFSNDWDEKTIKLSYQYEGNILPGPELYVSYQPLHMYLYRKMNDDEKNSIVCKENQEYYFEDQNLLSSVITALEKK